MPRLNAAQSFYGANSSSREAEIDLTKQKYEHAGYGSPASSITALRLERARQRGLGMLRPDEQAADAKLEGVHRVGSENASYGSWYTPSGPPSPEPRRKAFGKFGGRSDSPEKLRKSDATTSSNVYGLWAAAPNLSQPMPEVVRLFFDGTPMSAAKQSKVFGMYADDATLAFTGHGPPIALDKAGIVGAVASLQASFPDFTFNRTRIAPVAVGENCWAATIVVTGTHLGQPYSPMPHLPPIARTGKYVVIGPETFKLFVDADGKVVRHEIEVHEAGKPAGLGLPVTCGGRRGAPVGKASLGGAGAGGRVDAARGRGSSRLARRTTAGRVLLRVAYLCAGDCEREYHDQRELHYYRTACSHAAMVPGLAAREFVREFVLSCTIIVRRSWPRVATVACAQHRVALPDAGVDVDGAVEDEVVRARVRVNRADGERPLRRVPRHAQRVVAVAAAGHRRLRRRARLRVDGVDLERSEACQRIARRIARNCAGWYTLSASEVLLSEKSKSAKTKRAFAASNGHTRVLSP